MSVLLNLLDLDHGCLLIVSSVWLKANVTLE